MLFAIVNEDNKRYCDWSIWHLTSVKFLQIMKRQNGYLYFHIFLAYVLNKQANVQNMPHLSAAWSTCSKNNNFQRCITSTWLACNSSHWWLRYNKRFQKRFFDEIRVWNCSVMLGLSNYKMLCPSSKQTGNLLERHKFFKIAPRVLGEVLFNLASVRQRLSLTRNQKGNIIWVEQRFHKLLNITRKRLTSHTEIIHA